MSPEDLSIPARLAAKTDLPNGLAVLRLSLSEDVLFRAGQHVPLYLMHRGKTLSKPYSIASSPSHKRELEFYVRLIESGSMTPSLWDPDILHALESGKKYASISVGCPAGSMCLDPDDTRDLVFVASGTGIAPFMSMIRKLHEDAAGPGSVHRRKVYLIHGVSHPGSFGYRNELENLALQTLGDPEGRLGFVYLPTVSRPEAHPSWQGLRGRAESVLEDLSEVHGGSSTPDGLRRSMLQMVLQPETHAVYACGHPRMVENVIRILALRGYRLDLDLIRET